MWTTTVICLVYLSYVVARIDSDLILTNVRSTEFIKSKVLKVHKVDTNIMLYRLYDFIGFTTCVLRALGVAS